VPRKQSDLFNNILTVVSGTVIAQLIPILLQPILRRMYSPEDFGLFGVYTSIIGVVTVISTLRYSQTINIPKNDIVSTNLFALSFITAFIFYVLLTIFIIFFNDSILKISGIPSNRSLFLYFIPFSAFLFSTFEVINFWLIRKKEFKLAALNKIYRRSTEGIINVGFGLRGSYVGLIFGDIIGNIANVFSGIRRLKHIKFNFRNVSIRKIFFVARKYSDMPKFNLVPQTLNSICLFLPPFLINKFYSSETAGYFNLTLLVLNIPIVFVGNSISDVLIQRISDRRNNKLSIKKDFFNLVIVLSIASFIMIFFIMLVGEWAFGFVFGNQWKISGSYAKFYVWASAIRLIASPLNVVFIIFQEVRRFAIWQVGYFLSMLSLTFLGFLNFNSFLISITLINVIFYSIVFFMSKNVVINYEKSLN